MVGEDDVDEDLVEYTRLVRQTCDRVECEDFGKGCSMTFSKDRGGMDGFLNQKSLPLLVDRALPFDETTFFSLVDRMT